MSEADKTGAENAKLRILAESLFKSDPGETTWPQAQFSEKGAEIINSLLPQMLNHLLVVRILDCLSSH
jgi:hypothetical protein